MFDILRDQLWQGVSAIIAVIALIISISESKTRTKTIAQQIVLNMGRAVIGILVFLPSVSIYSTLFQIIRGGMPSAIQLWEHVSFARAFYYSLIYAIFPGTITAIASSRGKDFNHSTIIAIVTAFITTSLSDIYFILIEPNRPNLSILFPIISNFFGSLVAGPIIAYLVQVFDEMFLARSP